uniref:HAT C-terminal dimerisation domain-containing protein n=1 Tax=Oryza glumipatula TaxID=40148 RepID=A0A0D9Z6A8_9ORYZ
MIQKAFCPQYIKVSRKTTKNDIAAIYRSKLSVLKQTFSTTSFSFAVTSDNWASQHKRTSYLRIYYPTSCLVLEWIWKLALVFDENRSDRILSSIVKPMEEKFPKYFTSIPHLYCFALILDPRKKLEIAKVAMNSIGDAVGLDYSEAFQHVNDELYRVFHLYRTKLGGTPRVPEQTSQKKASKSSAVNLWKQYIGNDQASPSSENKSTWNPDSELNHYLVTNHTKHDPTLGGDDVDLLGWWKEKERTLPVLAHFARDILLVPASSVSSEQAFSVTGIIREKRTKTGWKQMNECNIVYMIKSLPMQWKTHWRKFALPKIMVVLIQSN